MLTKIAALWERIRTSLWFLPGLMIAGAVFLAWLALQVKLDLQESGFLWWINQGSAEEAGRLLAALLTSLITMATLVISITMVVLTLAAAQLGPRLIRSFVGDRRTQGVLGLFIATVVYILLIFRLLDSELPKDAVPHFAVTLASVLVFACLLTLLFYLNHLARSIVADTMVNRVGQDLDRAIQRNLRAADAEPMSDLPRPSEPPAPYAATASGYVQAVDYEGMAEALSGHDAVGELLVRPGHHLLQGHACMHVWPAKALDDELGGAIGRALVIGAQRTPVQDIEFYVRQLVEVALRALSPGINDPFTAIAVIDRLATSLALVMRRGEPQSVWSDAEDRARLRAAASSFDGVADLSLNQIRQAAASRSDVLIHMTDTLVSLVGLSRTPVQSAVLRRHADAVMETARLSIRHSSDLAEHERRYRELQPG